MLSWVLELENKLSQFSKLKGTTYKKWASGGFLKNKFLNFVKDFLCIYWDNHMAFIFQFVNLLWILKDSSLLTESVIYSFLKYLLPSIFYWSKSNGKDLNLNPGKSGEWLKATANETFFRNFMFNPNTSVILISK